MSSQPIVEIARAATTLPLSLLQDPEAIRFEILAPDLMIRQSTASPRLARKNQVNPGATG
jgi:DNA-binding LacI/PurR family transcriptional regulator